MQPNPPLMNEGLTSLYSEDCTYIGNNVRCNDIIGPHQPNLTVDVFYSPSTLPLVRIRVSSKPLWYGYVITEYRLNITNVTDDSLLQEITVPSDHIRNDSITLNINQSLFEATYQHCYTLRIRASAINSLYGWSEFSQVDATVFRGKLVVVFAPS